MPIETKTYKHYWTDKKWWQDEDYVEFPVLSKLAGHSQVLIQGSSFFQISSLLPYCIEEWPSGIDSMERLFLIFCR